MKQKILIAAPISGHKQYSIANWIHWIANQTHAEYDVLLCVNGSQQAKLVSMIKQTSWNDVHDQHKEPLVLWQEDKVHLTVSQRLVYARESIRRYMLAHDYTHLLFLDTDTIPLIRDAIPQLLKHELRFVNGWYRYKQSKVIVAVSERSKTNVTDMELKAAHADKKLLQVSITGFGCSLIERSVLEVCEFNFDKYGKEIGDDYGFCYQCDKQKILIWIDPIVTCMHLGKPTMPHVLMDRDGE